ncbi:antimicrobial peptide resistance and lipid A acylation PagP [Trinickia dabaoshanensis]|uniref:Antimicrobial peptide resistance and lipid A acylation PagP n=1 Tax=Trinickia dabaoshanensis TaxID=564714 RepID=A0A2N7VNY4_9BURK|nr:antimicrobial peptide resistance and lipid A acylation PagP [Trinickia dabaoshanensis]PMS18888.1 antimicrobial peptide resistance and lipid A acylation PagP [Trinickia dabaoshanensis]
MTAALAEPFRRRCAGRAIAGARGVCCAGLVAAAIAAQWGPRVLGALVPSAEAAQCGSGDGLYAEYCRRIGRVGGQGSWDLYLTGYGWHIDGYSSSYRASLNARSWGGGAGKHWSGADGREDIVFAFVFLDSHDHPEPIGGYARQWYTRPVLGGLALGGGYFIGVTARDDVFHYVPLPLALPIASLRYRKLSAMGTLIPRLGGLNKGDVAFFWMRYEF